MSSDPQTHQETYRLIVTRRGAAELLLHADGTTQRLPKVNVRTGKRLAVELTWTLRNDFGLEAWCLFVPRFCCGPSNATHPRYVVMESVGQSGNAPRSTSWVSTTSAAGKASLPDDEADHLQSALEEMGGYVAEPQKHPFARPGWITELFKWTQSQIDPLQLTLTGGFRQLNASPSFSLVRIETTGPAFWFKATGEPNRHELAITCTLTRLFPSYLPELLSVRPPWNGWLSRECPGRTLDTHTDASAWTQTARALGALEIASIGKSETLLACGCKDLRLSALAGQIDPFFARMIERMRLQKSEPPAILSNSDIRFLRDELKRACTIVQQIGLPDVLGHIDFNPGNIVISAEKSVFLDWAEGSLVSPFITFSYLREHARRSPFGAAGTQDQIARAYLDSWRPWLSRSALARGLACSSFLAVFIYALAIDQQNSGGAAESPALSGFLRSLARRMHREAAAIKAGGELCRH